MIITRSPLRICLGGGGTDLPSYYEKHGGFVISAAIDKYVYITLHSTFERLDDEQEIILKYSKMERVNRIENIQHPIFREALMITCDTTNMSIEIGSHADIHAGTGMGSSGSFTTALLKALHVYTNHRVTTKELAEEACFIEMNILGNPIGKQDQYIAAHGGLTEFSFYQDGQVKVSPLKLSTETHWNLEDNLLLFFTGYSRAASTILKDQDDKSKQNDQKMIDNLHFIKNLGYKSKVALEQGDLPEFAALMNVHWKHKKERSPGMSNPKIDEWYALAMQNGALGGKLIGAGGGGFLMFYAENKVKLRHAMLGAGLKEVRFRFDYEGAKTVTA